MTFKYTDSFENNVSQLVYAAYYNENNQELLVNLTEYGYIYQNIGKDTWTKFKEADSKGYFYNSFIKGRKGISHVGYLNSAFDFVKEDVIKPAFSISSGGAMTAKNIYVQHYNTTTGNNTNSLSVVPEQTYRYELVFETGGKERTHAMNATSLNEAVDALNAIADMLELTFKIKKVTVYFE